MSNSSNNQPETAPVKEIANVTDIDLDIQLSDEQQSENDNDDDLKKIVADQDFKQKTKMTFLVMFEIYRVIMASFTVLLIPQKCSNDGHLCSFSENINTTVVIKQVTLYLNLVSFLVFLVMYGIEIKREILMINTLDVNKHKPTSNESVEKALACLPAAKKDKIWRYDYFYKTSAQTGIFFYLVNLALTLVVLEQFYYDNKSLTVFLTNFLFMSLKLVDVLATVNTPKNIFYSSYLKRKVQFNDIDKDLVDKDIELLMVKA